MFFFLKSWQTSHLQYYLLFILYIFHRICILYWPTVFVFFCCRWVTSLSFIALHLLLTFIDCARRAVRMSRSLTFIIRTTRAQLPTYREFCLCRPFVRVIIKNRSQSRGYETLTNERSSLYTLILLLSWNINFSLPRVVRTQQRGNNTTFWANNCVVYMKM